MEDYRNYEIFQLADPLVFIVAFVLLLAAAWWSEQGGKNAGRSHSEPSRETAGDLSQHAIRFTARWFPAWLQDAARKIDQRLENTTTEHQGLREDTTISTIENGADPRADPS